MKSDYFVQGLKVKFLFLKKNISRIVLYGV